MAKEKMLAPYIKENNLLQLPLFHFGRTRKEKTEIKWGDGEKDYTLYCTCRLGVPGGFEMDVYTACMRIWVKLGMPPERIEVTYSEIARELNLNPRDWNYEIRNALERLAQARYQFNNCFIRARSENNDHAHFSLFNFANLFYSEDSKSRTKGKTILEFPKEIRVNLEEKYYQYLDMAWYRSMQSGLPRRLYEYLAKRKYHGINGVFRISEVVLCRWLPIHNRHVTSRRKTLKNIAQELIDKGYLAAYEFDKEKKQCIFTYAKNAAPQQETIEIAVEPVLEKKKLPPVNEPIQAESHSQDELIELVKLKRIPKALREIVGDYTAQKSSEYVKRNILYANQNAKRNYSTYLQKALANDWGKVWAEEQKIKQKAMEQEQAFDPNEAIRLAEEHRQKEEEAKKQRVAEIEKQRVKFKAKVAALGSILRDGIKKKAEQETPVNCPPQALRGKYSMLLLDAVNQMGSNFSSEVLSPALAKELWEIK